MLDLKALIENTEVPASEAPKADRRPLAVAPRPRRSQEPQQRRMMATALSLLLFALALVLYHDRDFWFSDTPDAEDQPAEPAPATSNPPARSVPDQKKHVNSKPRAKESAPVESDPPATVTAERTVLPPLEVEVVADNTRRVLHAGSNSVKLNLQPSPAESIADVSTAGGAPPANVTTEAAERVQMSADASEAVTRSVNPGYPTLARQMKVQGSVVLQALISRDGSIQDLEVLSGPPILASAAEEAVRQWHFKPHYQGPAAVETQARITVNFTISTN